MSPQQPYADEAPPCRAGGRTPEMPTYKLTKATKDREKKQSMTEVTKRDRRNEAPPRRAGGRTPEMPTYKRTKATQDRKPKYDRGHEGPNDERLHRAGLEHDRHNWRITNGTRSQRTELEPKHDQGHEGPDDERLHWSMTATNFELQTERGRRRPHWHRST